MNSLSQFYIDAERQVLDRARKAEAEVITLKSQLKNETTTSKKTIRDMESSLTEGTARTQKAEREYAVLRDSIKDLVHSFETDAANLREEVKRREDKLKADAEEMGKKYKRLLEQVQKERESGGLGEIKWLLHENKRLTEQMETVLKEEMVNLRGEVDRHAQESDEAIQTAKCVTCLWSSSVSVVTDYRVLCPCRSEHCPASSRGYGGSCDKQAPPLLQRRGTHNFPLGPGAFLPLPPHTPSLLSLHDHGPRLAHAFFVSILTCVCVWASCILSALTLSLCCQCKFRPSPTLTLYLPQDVLHHITSTLAPMSLLTSWPCALAFRNNRIAWTFLIFLWCQVRHVLNGTFHDTDEDLSPRRAEFSKSQGAKSLLTITCSRSQGGGWL